MHHKERVAQRSVIGGHKRSKQARDPVHRKGSAVGSFMSQARSEARPMTRFRVMLSNAASIITLVSPSVRFCMCTQNSHKSISPSRSMSSCGVTEGRVRKERIAAPGHRAGILRWKALHERGTSAIISRTIVGAGFGTSICTNPSNSFASMEPEPS